MTLLHVQKSAEMLGDDGEHGVEAALNNQVTKFIIITNNNKVKKLNCTIH